MTKRDIVVKIAKEMNFVQSDVATIVQSVNQTFVDSLKQSGIFTKESKGTSVTEK